MPNTTDLRAKVERRSSQSKLIRSRLLVLAAAVLFSTGGAAIKVEAFDAAQVSCFRSAIAALTLALWVGGRVQLTPGALTAGAAYAATLLLFVTSTKLTTAAQAIFLQSTAPLYILVLAPLLLRERFARSDLWTLAAMAVGIAFCFAGSPTATAIAPNPRLGNVLAAAAGAGWAATLMALRHAQRNQAEANVGIRMVVIGNVMAALVAAPGALPVPDATAGEWLTILYLGVLQIGLAYICLTHAMRHLPALQVSLLLLLEPVLNPLWTWIVHGESVGWWVVAGGSIILAATAAQSFAGVRSTVTR